MDENGNEVLYVADAEDEEVEQDTTAADEQFREQIKGTIRGMQSKSRLDGMKTMAQLILTVINSFEKKVGKKRCSDYKRLVKDIKKACKHALEDKSKDEGESNKEADSNEQESENRG